MERLQAEEQPFFLAVGLIGPICRWARGGLYAGLPRGRPATDRSS